MAKPQVTVLLTCASSPMAVEAIVALQASRSLRVRVVGVDMTPGGAGRSFVSAFYKVPPGNDPAYVDRLLAICRREKVRVVIPTSDEEALTLARTAGRFRARGVTCTVPREELVEVLGDKGRMYDYLAQRGVAVPRHVRATTPAELKAAAAALGYPARPFVVKPASARGGRGVWVIREHGASLQELTQGVALDAVTLDGYVRAIEDAGTMPALLAMEFLAGDVFDVDILGAGGRLKQAVARRRFHPRTTPFRGCVLERNAEVLALTRSVHQALALDYLQDIDIIAADDGRVHLLEVNPRQSASVIATVAAGRNLLEDLVRVALGLVVKPGRVPYGRAIYPSVRTTALGRA